ncbi:hypothetical protein BSLG_009430 [Batrachochytrium salamandrivorans]|nr:hypothetical protein BSLG_009430 [Batrachochytrium salamandrivorans]
MTTTTIVVQVYDMPASINRQLRDAMGIEKDQWQLALAQSYSFYAAPNIVMPFVAAVLVDQIGSHMTMLLLSLVVVTGSALFSFAIHIRSLPMLLFGRFVLGLAGESLSVAQARLTCSWFGGAELAFALGMNLSASRLGSVLNDLLTPSIAMLPNNILGDFLETERAPVLLAVWVGTFFCLVSTVSAIIAVIIDLVNLQTSDYTYLEPYPYTDSVDASLCASTPHADLPSTTERNIDVQTSLSISNDLVGHRTSTQAIQNSACDAPAQASSLLPSSFASSEVSGRIPPQTLVRKWWSSSTDNLAHVHHINISDATHFSSPELFSNEHHKADLHGQSQKIPTTTKNSGDTSLHVAATHRDDKRSISPGKQFFPGFLQEHDMEIPSSNMYDGSASASMLLSPPSVEFGSLSPLTSRSTPHLSSHRRPSQSLIEVMPLVMEEECPEDYTRELPSPEIYSSAMYSLGDSQSFSYNLWTDLCLLPIEFWLIVSLMIIYYGGTVTLINVLSDELQNSAPFHNNAQYAGFFLAIPDLLSTFLVPLCGRVVQYRGRRIVVLGICGIMMVVVHIAFLYANENIIPPVFVFAFALTLLGIVYALYICVVWPLISFVVPEELQATAYALSTSLLNLGLLCFPLISAQLISTAANVSDYTAMHYLFIGTSTLGALIICPLLFWVDQARNDGMLNMCGNVGEKRIHPQLESESEVYCDYDVYPNYYQQSDRPLGYDGHENEENGESSGNMSVPSRFPGASSLPDQALSKRTGTERWIEYGTMYGTLSGPHARELGPGWSRESLSVSRQDTVSYDRLHRVELYKTSSDPFKT